MPAQTFTKAHRLVAVVLLAAVLLTACERLDQLERRVTGEGAPELSQTNADVLIDLAVLDYLDDRDLPGATLAITKNGRLVWSKGYGWSNRHTQTPMQPYQRSRIGSVAKLLTTIAVLQLVETEAIALDDRVYGTADWRNAGWRLEDLERWEPTVSGGVLADPEDYWLGMVEGARNLQSQYGPVAPRLFEAASQVEVKHLLSHTSGIPGGGDISRAEQRFGRDRWSDLTYRHLHLAAMMGLRDAREDSRDVAKVFGGMHHVPREIEMTFGEYVDTYLDHLTRWPWFTAWLDRLDVPHDEVMTFANPDFTGRQVTLPPFGFEPGRDRTYSNHSFGLAGYIVAERTGTSYQAYVENEILAPIGATTPGALPGGGTGFVPNWYPLGGVTNAFPHGAGLDPERPDPHDMPKLSGPLGLATGGWSASAQDLVRVMCGLDRSSNHLRLLDRETVEVMESIVTPAAPTQPLGWDYRLDGVDGTELSKGGTITGGRALIKKFLPGHFDDPDTEINVAIGFNQSTDATPNALLRRIADLVAATDIADDYDLFDPDHACVVDGPTITIDEPGDGRRAELGEELHFAATATDARGEPLPVTWHLPDDVTRTTQPSAVDGRAGLFTDQLPQGTHTIVAVTEDSGGHQASDAIEVEITYAPPEVGILTPQAEATTIWAHEDLRLSGWSRTREHFTLPDDAVGWRVTREGESGSVHSTLGHTTTIPAPLVEPGTYTIAFRGSDGIRTAVDEITLTIEARPDDLPTATITAPAQDDDVQQGRVHSHGEQIDVTGAGVDHRGVQIDGTRFRWTVLAPGDQQGTVVCEGSRFGAVGAGGGPGPATDCEGFTTAFEPADLVIAGEGITYLVVLEVSDLHGNIGSAERTIIIYVPPAA